MHGTNQNKSRERTDLFSTKLVLKQEIEDLKPRLIRHRKWLTEHLKSYKPCVGEHEGMDLIMECVILAINILAVDEIDKQLKESQIVTATEIPDSESTVS